ncbi:MAG: hypothetical protein ACFFDN_51375, partial [Candidatus Hodarchaeota archaeon]
RKIKMVIFELGIVKSGVPLVSKQYYKEYNVNVDSVLRAGFLSGLTTFVKEVFSDNIESFTMKNFKIAFISHFLNQKKGENIICFVIGDKNLKLKFAKKALTEVLNEFLKKYGNLENFSGDLNIFSEFSKVLDEILGDLIRKPDERFRSVFE